MKKKTKLLLFASLMLSNLMLFANTQQTGELISSKVGQGVNDHIFARFDYYWQNQNLITYDNIVCFCWGTPQLLWLWLNDDEIYSNNKVQSLAPALIEQGGQPYNEITYSSVQFDIYLPSSICLTNAYGGNSTTYERGARLPLNSLVSCYFYECKEIDGVLYNCYHVNINNQSNYGAHFSSMDAESYVNNGALKTNDAPLIGFYLGNYHQGIVENWIDDIIIANIEFSICETTSAGWSTNESRFFYGNGGNNQSQCFQLYNRIGLFGAGDFDPFPEINGFRYMITGRNKASLIADIHYSYYEPYPECIQIPDTITSQGSSFVVTTISRNAFINSTRLKNIVLPNSVTEIEAEAFDGCTNLQTISFSNSLEQIGDSAFFGCKKLQSIELPQALTTIGNSAFQNCSSIKDLTLGENITTLGKNAFYGCNAIEKVTSKSDNAPLMGNANCFNANVYNDATLFIPIGATENYQLTNYWNKFINIEEIAMDGVCGDLDGDGSLGISDVSMLIDSLLLGKEVDLAVGDVNGDGTVDIGDVAALIDILLFSI